MKLTYSKIMAYSALGPIYLLVAFPKNSLINLTAYVPVIFVATFFSALGFGLLKEKKLGLTKDAVLIISLFALITIYFGIAIIVTRSVNERSLMSILKYAFFACVFLIAYFFSHFSNQNNIYKALINTAALTLILQLVIFSVTFANPTVFDWIWSAEKTRGVGQILRLTGSMYNPNTLGLLILNLYAILMLLVSRTIKRSLFLSMVCLALILLTGSRISVVSFVIFSPVLILLNGTSNLDFVKLLKVGFFGSMIALLFAWVISIFLQQYGGTFRYLSRLNSIEFSSVTAFFVSLSEQTSRFSSWSAKWEYFYSSPGDLKWLFGLGVDSRFRVGDNDYFYSFWHWGSMGFFLGYLIYIVTIICCPRSSSRLRLLLWIVFFQLVIYGFMLETFHSWFHPVLFWILAGISYSSGWRRFKPYYRYAPLGVTSK